MTSAMRMCRLQHGSTLFFVARLLREHYINIILTAAISHSAQCSGVVQNRLTTCAEAEHFQKSAHPGKGAALLLQTCSAGCQNLCLWFKTCGFFPVSLCGRGQITARPGTPALTTTEISIALLESLFKVLASNIPLFPKLIGCTEGVPHGHR